jgi:hypothetical protein
MTNDSDPSPLPGEGGDDSDGSIQDPVEVTSPQTEAGVSLLDRLNPNWIAWFVVIAIIVTVGIAVWLSLYVVLAGEDSERADFDQLSKIIDPLQSIATLMIGTIFGFTVQSGATALNRHKADKNKAEAEKQNQQAAENAKRARANANVAAVQADAANELRNVVTAMRDHYEPRTDSSDQLFITRSSVRPSGSGPVQLDDYIDQVIARANDKVLSTHEYQRYLR